MPSASAIPASGPRTMTRHCQRQPDYFAPTILHALVEIGSPYRRRAAMNRAVVADVEDDHAATTPFSMFHTFSGVAGISICTTPRSASASTTAFITDGRAPAHPASPQPFAPSALVRAGTGWLAKPKNGACSARGKP